MPVDPLDYRRVIGAFATGVAVVTADHDGEPFGMTANSVTSLSLDPTLLIVCFIHGSKTAIAVKESGYFGVNILDETQEAISSRFAVSANDWDGVRWEIGPHGAPLLKQTLGRIVCRLDRVVDGGDHAIVIGEANYCDPGESDVGPLLFFKGEYREMATLDSRAR